MAGFMLQAGAAVPAAACGAALSRRQQRGSAGSSSVCAARPLLLLPSSSSLCSSRRQQAAAVQAPRALPGSSGGSGEPTVDMLVADCPVPPDQQPLRELQQLLSTDGFDLATKPPAEFARRIATGWLGFYVALGLPVSAFTFDWHKELLQLLAAASVGSTFIVTVLVWRLVLGWSHVGARLRSVTIYYEETGWYDQASWVKTPEMLARDRLADLYQVRPALARLKRTMLALGGGLVASVVLLAVPPSSNSSSGGGGGGEYASYTVSSGGSSTGGSGGYSEAAAARYEPWAAGEQGEDEGEGAGAAGQYDMRSHMMLQAPRPSSLQ